MDENTTTTPTAVTASVWEDVLTAREVLARLARTDVSMLPDDDVDGTAHPAEEVLRMAAVLPQALAGQIRARGLDTDRGARSTESYLRSVLRIDIGEAKARMAAVDRFHPRPQPSGEVLPPGS